MAARYYENKDFESKKLINFSFKEKEYPIYSIVKLSDKGREILKTDLINVQLCSHNINHTISSNKYEETHSFALKWQIFQEKNLSCTSIKSSNLPLDEIIEGVVMIAPLPGVLEGLQNEKMASFWHTDIIWELTKCVFWWISSFIFADMFLRTVVIVWATIYYYIKVDRLHNQYIIASFRTFENRHKITIPLVFDLYFSDKNRVHPQKESPLDI